MNTTTEYRKHVYKKVTEQLTRAQMTRLKKAITDARKMMRDHFGAKDPEMGGWPLDLSLIQTDVVYKMVPHLADLIFVELTHDCTFSKMFSDSLKVESIANRGEKVKGGKPRKGRSR